MERRRTGFLFWGTIFGTRGTSLRGNILRGDGWLMWIVCVCRVGWVEDRVGE